VVIHFHRWVVWWFFLGLIGGAIGLVNIFFLDLTHTQERVILFFGVLHWLLGGLVCWAWEGVTLHTNTPHTRETYVEYTWEQNVASDLVTHRRSLRRPLIRHDPMTLYLLHHWQDKGQHHS